MANDIIQVNRIPVQSFEVALYDGTNADWIIREFFDSNRGYLVDPSNQMLTYFYQNNQGPMYLMPGQYAKRTKPQEDTWQDHVNESELHSGGGYIFVDPEDYPGPLDDPMS